MDLEKLRMMIIECLESNSIKDVQNTIDDVIYDFTISNVYKYDEDDDSLNDFESMRNTKKKWQ